MSSPRRRTVPVAAAAKTGPLVRDPFVGVEMEGEDGYAPCPRLEEDVRHPLMLRGADDRDGSIDPFQDLLTAHLVYDPRFGKAAASRASCASSVAGVSPVRNATISNRVSGSVRAQST